MIEKERLVQIVGPENVSQEEAELRSLASDLSFVSAVRPDYVVKVRNSGDVEPLVKLARETGTPLVPVSSGAPHFRGDTVPSVGGAVMVDLSGLKKILRVDRVNRTVMFEPGVTFGELIPAAAKEGLRLNIPLLPRLTKSVTASMLEREPVVMPTYHWDIADPLQCVEVIFGSGDKFRTGAAAGPGDLDDQWKAGGGQVEAAGPSSASWYRVIGGSQGTMGIVTWSSARCEIVPQLEQPYLVGYSDLSALLEMAHWLVRLRIPNECFILNKMNLAAMAAGDFSNEYQRIKDSLPPWILFYNLAGYEYLPEKRVKAHIEDASGIAQRCGVEAARSCGKISAFDWLKMVQAPGAEPYWKFRLSGGGQDNFFITNYQGVSETVEAMYQMAERSGYPVTDLGVYIQPLVQGCNYHVEFNYFCSPDNQADTQRVRDLIKTAVNPLMFKGAFFSRPYGEISRAILNKDAASVESLKKVKKILDPDNVMNPGKLCF